MNAKRRFWLRWLRLSVWLVMALGAGLIAMAVLPKLAFDPALRAFWPSGGRLCNLRRCGPGASVGGSLVPSMVGFLEDVDCPRVDCERPAFPDLQAQA